MRLSNTESLPGLDAAVQDLRDHTLAGIRGSISRLVYLASTRDYNTGEYHHDGIAFRFNEEVANRALAFHHRTIFLELLACSVEELVEQLDLYIQQSAQTREEFLRLWKTLQPFRVAVPRDATYLEVSLLVSNIKAALEILEHRQNIRSPSTEDQQSS